jgi:hypothetical protein
MSEHRIIRTAGTLLHHRQYLQLYVLEGETRKEEACLPSLEPGFIRRLTGGVMMEPEAHAFTGFACLRAIGSTWWRCAFYAWDADGLSRIVFNVDAATGERYRAAETAFQIGCEAEVELIGMELAARRTNQSHAMQPVHHLESHL